MKYCIHCGEPNSDESQVCLKCQKPFPNVEEQSVQNNNDSMQSQHNLTSFPMQTVPVYSTQLSSVPAPKKKKSSLGIFSGILSIMSGLFFIVFGLFDFYAFYFYNTYTDKHIYGADFYTYTSEQLEGIGDILGSIGYAVDYCFNVLFTIFGVILVVLGLFIIAYFRQKAQEK